MKKRFLVALILCIAILTGILPVHAEESYTAVLSSQKFYVDGSLVDILAYSINDFNNVRVRELGKAVNFSVFYDASMNSVRIDRNYAYAGGDTEVLPSPGNIVSAVVSNQSFFVSGVPVNIAAFNIANNNYAQLRDVCGAINLGLAYDPTTNSVYMDTKTAYLPNMSPDMLRPEAIPKQVTQPNLDENTRTPITEKVLDGSEWAREDFSQQANPAIFNGILTRAAYNAIRQSIVDRDIILADNNEKGYNLYYRYANFTDKTYTTTNPGDTYRAIDKVLWSFNAYYQYTLGVEPYVKNIYDYWGYAVGKVVTHDFYAPANQATESFINEVKALASDREKIDKLNSYLCSKIYYDANEHNGTNKIFTSITPVGGACGTFSEAFNYLCHRAEIPCVKVQSETHGWNVVYVDGHWYVVDITANMIAPPEYKIIFLWETHPDYTDKYPNHTEFAKELLVPSYK